VSSVVETSDTRICGVQESGDWKMFEMIIGGKDRRNGIYSHVFGRFQDGRLVQWTTKCPSCFFVVPSDGIVQEVNLEGEVPDQVFDHGVKSSKSGDIFDKDLLNLFGIKSDCPKDTRLTLTRPQEGVAYYHDGPRAWIDMADKTFCFVCSGDDWVMSIQFPGCRMRFFLVESVEDILGGIDLYKKSPHIG